MHRRTWWAVAGVLTVILVAWLLRDFSVEPDSTKILPANRAEAPHLDTGSSGRTDALQAERTAVAAPEQVATRLDPPPTAAEITRFGGVVVDEMTGRGIAGLVLRAPALPAALTQQIPVTTDANGRFVYEFVGRVPIGHSIVLRITREGDPRNALFYGTVSLGPDMVIVVPVPVVFAGRIHDIPSTVPGFCPGAFLTCWAPPNAGVARYVGGTQVAPDGSFRIEARSSLDCPEFLLELQCGNMALLTTSNRTDLASGNAVLRFEPRTVTVEVLDPRGAPVAAVTLCWLPTEGRSNAASRATTDASGRANLLVARSRRHQLAAWKEGSPVALATFGPDEDRVRLVLPTADATASAKKDNHGIEGTVLDRPDQPVEDVVVTAVPVGVGRLADYCGLLRARTDADGRFRLPAPAGQEVIVAAFHGVEASTRHEVIPPRRDLVLRLAPSSSIDVDVRPAIGGLPNHSGPFDYVLTDEAGQVMGKGADLMPTTLFDVDARTKRLLVRLGRFAYGEAEVAWNSEHIARVQVLLEPPAILSVQVVADDVPAVGATVLAHGGSWSPDVAAAFGPAMTNEAGRAELPCNAAAMVTIDVQYRGRRVRRQVDRMQEKGAIVVVVP